MNNENEELIYLVEAISLLRNDIKEINQKLGRIEKRIQAFFQKYKELKEKETEFKYIETNKKHLLQMFEELITITKEKEALPAKWWPGSCPNSPNETGLQA
jgi:inorganic pyrophosphatase